MARRCTRLLGVVGFILVAVAGDARAQLIIDNFASAGTLAPPGLSYTASISGVNSSIEPAPNLFTSSLPGVLGGRRIGGMVGALATGVGGSASVNNSVVVNPGGGLTYTGSLATSGPSANASALALAYGSLAFTASESASSPPPSASASIAPTTTPGSLGTIPQTLLADLSSGTEIDLAFSALNAGAVGTKFTVTLFDTSLDTASVTDTVGAAGSQSLSYSLGAFKVGGIDLTKVSGVGLTIAPTSNGSFTLTSISVAAVPEPSAMALATVGAAVSLAFAVLRPRSAPPSTS